MSIAGAIRFSPPGARAGPDEDISGIGHDMAFGCFTLAVALEGIDARYSLNQAVGEGFEHEGLAVPSLVARAHQVLGADD